jgi:hypothetical protein
MSSGKSLLKLAQSPLEAKLLNQIVTFRLTTRLAWNYAELKEHSPLEISQALRRMTKSRIVEAHPLHHGRFYFTLTSKTATQLDLTCTGGPLSESAKVRAYAKLLLGVIYLPGFVPLRGATLAERIGEHIVGLPDLFMVNPTSKLINLVRLDVQPAASPARTAQQLRQDLFRLASTPTLKQLVRDGQLKIALVACSIARCQSILEHFRKYERVGNVPVRTIAIDQLIPLLLPIDWGESYSLKKMI